MNPQRFGTSLLFALAILVALGGCDWNREKYLLEQSGLDIARHSVTSTFSDEVSIRFGAEGRSRMVFRLPDGYAGLDRCGQEGYSTIRIFEFAEGNIEPQAGCRRYFVTSDGTVFDFKLFDNQLFITVRY